MRWRVCRTWRCDDFVPRTRLATIARGCEIHVAAPRVRMVELGTSETLTAAHRTASAFSADENAASPSASAASGLECGDITELFRAPAGGLHADQLRAGWRRG